MSKLQATILQQKRTIATLTRVKGYDDQGKDNADDPLEEETKEEVENDAGDNFGGKASKRKKK